MKTDKYNSKTLTEDLIRKIREKKYSPELGFEGKVIEAGDGVAKIAGLNEISYSEMVEFANGVRGFAINLEEREIGAVILGEFEGIREGDSVKALGKLLSIGVDEKMVGRVIDPLGNTLDGKGKINYSKYYPVEKIAPGVIKRKPVDVPLQTGIKAIDSMIPIGRGQRELIIGDRATGKTTIAIDTIINQRGKGVICIYVAIGQKSSRVAQIIETLRKNKALDHTIIVAANASDSAALQFIAPYSGTAIGEYFMDKGKDALVVFDDLTKHSWAYRQISLILRRPSGREAYPGDIFYLHSRLLERACRLNEGSGGGSLTALPIIETQAGDVSAYIPTNVISITDGQIYLEPDLFYAGIRPAVNAGLSVSRVGGNAQIKAMKQVAGKLRLDLAQYRELAAFVQFASDLDQSTRIQIERGSRMMELLKQGQNIPMEVEEEIAVLFAGINGFLDDVEVTKVSDFEERLLVFLKDNHAKILDTIKKEKAISDVTHSKLKQAMADFKKVN